MNVSIEIEENGRDGEGTGVPGGWLEMVNWVKMLPG